MRHQIVIGAGYGDEGKGRMIDYFANITKNKKLVVRFNGGSQAGHNVVLASGQSHIHSHFASGSLSGHDTYLSKYFVCNPKAFLEEWHSLISFFNVYADPKVMVTTPYDMIINQGLETKRGAARHGSVGVGFGETIKRYEEFGSIDLFLQPREVRKYYLQNVRDYWFMRRCKHEGIEFEPFMGEEIITEFLDDLDSMEYKIDFAQLKDITSNYEQVLFEGAQGLMLDMDYGAFPHVTRSNTGLKNAVALINTLDLSQTEFDVCYVTRSYVTRHGAGPLENESKELVNFLDVSKETNVTGQYQGSFRYARFDPDILSQAIRSDLWKYNPRNIQLAVTCLDQWKQAKDMSDYQHISIHTKASTLYAGYGPNREKTTIWKLPV